MSEVAFERTSSSRFDIPCSVAGCGRPIQTKVQGLCCAHRRRARLYGSPDAPTPVRHYNGTGYVNKYGYRMISVKGSDGKFRQAPEHRLVMERVLGRPLLSFENVHHVNGDKSDNRPANLELWIRRQPTGQRASDLVTFAREILQLYGERFGV